MIFCITRLSGILLLNRCIFFTCAARFCDARRKHIKIAGVIFMNDGLMEKSCVIGAINQSSFNYPIRIINFQLGIQATLLYKFLRFLQKPVQ